MEWFTCHPEESSRFASDTTGWLFFELSLWLRTQALGKAGVVLEHDPQIAHVTRDELLAKVRSRDSELRSKVWAFSRAMRGTPPYWHEFYKRTLACCGQWEPH